MRMTLAAVAAVALAGVAVGVDAGATAAPASHTSTTRIVIRPVTQSGHATPGYVVHRERSGQVDCSYPDPSPGAVSRNIELCSPSAEYAIACWKASSRHHVLCMRDPTKQQVVKIPRTGKFAHTKRASRAERAPLLLVLSDGTHCSIRDGGAWGSLRSHPKWNGTYSCTKHGVVWSPPKAHHHGVNESAPSWTVRTAPFGHGHVTIRHVARAYFVGTATS